MADNTPSPFNTPGVVRGTIRDEKGEPIRYVNVTLKDNKISINLFTDEYGNFNAGQPLPPGEYFLYFTDRYGRGLFMPQRKIKVPEEVQIPVQVVATYKKGYHNQAGNNLLSGTVTDDKGLPLHNVGVTVTGPVTRNSATNDQGRYEAGPFPDGNYKVIFFHGLYNFVPVEITLSGGGWHNADATGRKRLRGYNDSNSGTRVIQGYVTDWNKKVLPGIRVTITAVEKNNPFKYLFATTSVTNEQGHFLCREALEPGTYSLIAKDPNKGYKFIKYEVRLPRIEGPVHIHAIAPNIITGYTFSNKKFPLPGMRVKITGPVTLLKISSLGGYFTSKIPLPNGAYSITIEDPKQKYVFNPGSVILTGKSVPPKLFIGKPGGKGEEKTKQKQEKKSEKPPTTPSVKPNTQPLPRGAPTRLLQMNMLGRGVRKAGRVIPSVTKSLGQEGSKLASSALNNATNLGARGLSNLPSLGGLLNQTQFLAGLGRVYAGAGLGFILLVIVFLFTKSTTINALPENANISPNGGSNQPGSGGTNPIPGLPQLQKQGPESVTNGENIKYTITIPFDSSSPVSIDTITVFDKIPNKTQFVEASGTYELDSTTNTIKWPLKETANRGIITLTLKPLEPDILVTNQAYATTTFSGGGGSGGTCSEGTGYCSEKYLEPYFGSDAKNASIVCNGESRGNPDAINTNCNTNDYSVGLFQINLVANCPGAYGAGRWGPQSCDNLLSKDRRDYCENLWRNNPTENVKKAVEIFKRRGGWSSDWGAARACSIR